MDDFQKKYEALQIPYPKDTLGGSLASQATEQKSAYDKFMKESNVRVGTFKEELAKWEAMMPIEDMNKEELMQAAPELVPEHNPKDPQFWPFDRKYDPQAKKKALEDYNRTYWDH